MKNWLYIPPPCTEPPPAAIVFTDSEKWRTFALERVPNKKSGLVETPLKVKKKKASR